MAKSAKKNIENDENQLVLIHRNQHNLFWHSTLFNEVYLQNDVPVFHTDVWIDDEVSFEQFLTQFQNYVETLEGENPNTWSERTTINRIIKPLLDILGYTSASNNRVEPWLEDEPFSIQEPEGIKTYKPDFIVVNDHKELKYIQSQSKAEKKLAEARESVILPIEVKYWGRIDEYKQSQKEDLKRADKNSNGEGSKILDFDEQCLKYMEILNKQYGILTDGKTWRLYNLSFSSQSYRPYFQFNLGHMIKHVQNSDFLKNTGDYELFKEEIKYFYFLFRKKAFYSESGEELFVNELLEYSKKYVAKAEEDLKDRFVNAMTIACNGFQRAAQNEGEKKVNLDIIRSVSESHIFNILFLKYCEARNILPIKQDPEGYRKISISNVLDRLERFDPNKEEDNLNYPLLKRMFSDISYAPSGAQLYERLLKLTKIVQDGTEDFQGFSIKGFKESIYSKDEWKFAQKFKLSNQEMICILFELGYSESDILGRKYQQIPYNSFSPRQLGSIYESFLEFKLEKAPEDLAFINKQWISANLKSEKMKKMDVPKVKKGNLFFTPNNEDRKVTGSYYTPDSIVQYIVAETLNPLVKNQPSKEILKLKVCDPAMGSAHFLNGVLNFISKKYIEAIDRETHDDLTITLLSAKRKVLHSCIYGVDINPRAVKLAKMSLWLESASSSEPLENLDDQLKVGDALVSNLPNYDKNFKWDKEFSDITFNAVVGNPPWISLLGKHKAASFDTEYIEHLIKSYDLDTNRPNVYEAFVRKSLELIKGKQGAMYGVITPDRLGLNEQFTDLRRYILSNFSLETVVYGTPFPGVIVDTGIFIISSEKKRNSYVGINYPDLRTLIEYKQVEGDRYVSFSVNSQDHTPSILKTENSTELVNGGICSSFVGFIAGKGKLSDVPQKGYSKALKGRDIQPFKIIGSHYVKLEKSSFIGGTQDIQKLTAKTKILIRKTGNRIIAALDNSGVAIEQSLYALYDFKNIDPKALVCFLNSDTASDFYMANLVTNKSSTPQLKKIHLDQFPIPVALIKANEKKLAEIYDESDKLDADQLKSRLDKIFKIGEKQKTKKAA